MNSMFQGSNALISRKGLHLLLVLTSMIVYLEWGGGNQSFLVEAEKELFIKIIERSAERNASFYRAAFSRSIFTDGFTLYEKSSQMVKLVGNGLYWHTGVLHIVCWLVVRFN